MLRFTTITLPMAGPGPGNGLPILDAGGARQPSPAEARLLGLEGCLPRPPSLLPYDAQDGFDRTVSKQPTPVAVLENKRLRATFLLALGGRLWSLLDKGTGRNLLHQPEVLRHANLALRKAWFAGGVEWNLGCTGHWPLTSSPVFAGAVTQQVLRLWAYERMLRLVWRLDVSLPEGSEDLLVRVVLHNPHRAPVPVYWLSTIAVPLAEQGRVLMPARAAWCSNHATIEKVEITAEMLRPDQVGQSYELFGDLPGLQQPWVAAVDADGYGLQQTSTARLRGRELFTWGVGAGGRRWQQWLGGDRPYAEIQAGLAPTQLHHLQLPASQTWSWTESYGPVRVPADYPDLPGPVPPPRAVAVASADQALAEVERLPVEVHHYGDGWGALEVAAGHLSRSPATPFPGSTLSAEQRPWLGLIDHGWLRTPAAPVLGGAWAERLARAGASPERDLHLGYQAWARGETDQARACWQRSYDADGSPRTLRALALTADPVDVDALAEAADRDGSVALRVEYLEAAVAAGRYQEVVAATEQIDPGPRAGRLTLLRVTALVGLGRAEQARALLDGRLEVNDLREGSLSFSEVWEATHPGEPLPAEYDFRMRP